MYMTPRWDLLLPIKQHVFKVGGNWRTSEKTHVDTGRTYELHIERRAELRSSWTFLLWSVSVNHCTAVLLSSGGKEKEPSSSCRRNHQHHSGTCRRRRERLQKTDNVNAMKWSWTTLNWDKRDRIKMLSASWEIPQQPKPIAAQLRDSLGDYRVKIFIKKESLQPNLNYRDGVCLQDRSC